MLCDSFRRTLRRLAADLALMGLAMMGLALAGGPAWAKCQLGNVATLPVTMLGMRALLPAKINGQDVQFVVDSGAFFSFITPANADKFKLPRRQLPFGMTVSGTTGAADADVGIVDVLTLADTQLHHIEFVVSGSEIGEGSVGLLGQNVLGGFDVEYDLAKGVIHLWKPKDCSDRTDMAYWTSTLPESVINIDVGDGRYVNKTQGPVYVNGVELSAIFDTGAPRTMMTRHGAARAGIKPGDPGVVSAGYTGGVGKRLVPSWITPVKSFRIDQEKILNTKMIFADIELPNADMLVGADFFLAHHIFVSNHQNKLYLTYNGGPVFNLEQTPVQIAGAAPTPAPAPAPAPAATASAPAPASGAPAPATANAATANPATANPAAADPADAAGFARRGAGYAARNDLAAAIADLSKAIQMAPTVPDYPYERGLFYERNRQPFLAMADFDETLKLKPDDVAALVARAALRLAGHDKSQAAQDLAAADKASAKQDDVRLTIATLYVAADLPSAAIDQFSLWIDTHSEDARLPRALNGRCWQRALTGVDLDKALNDCNRAIRNAPKTAAMFDSRGLVHLRLGDLDKAIADYDAALALNPKLGWSLYGRGLAKQRKGLTADGAADIAAAVAINPKLPEEATKHGLT